MSRDTFNNDLTQTDSFGSPRVVMVQRPTPRPWRVDNRFSQTKPRSVTETSVTYWHLKTEMGDGVLPCESESEARANADLIIRAVNNHEALVVALEDELEAIRVWQSARGVPADVRDGLQISMEKIRTVLRNARQTER